MPKRKRRIDRKATTATDVPARPKRRRIDYSKLPPLIDMTGTTPEEIAQQLLRTRTPEELAELDRQMKEGPEYRCVDCNRLVWYPETYYNDGRCEQCHEG